MFKRESAMGVTAAMVLSFAVGGVVQAAATFKPGDIVVTRAVGGTVDPTAAPGTVGTLTSSNPIVGNGVAATVEIDEYTPAGAFVQSFDLPNVQQTSTAPGSTYALTLSDGQNLEGSIELSGDGRYFSLVGYNQTGGSAGGNGITGTNASPSATVQRVVGLIGMNGSVNTTTGLTDVANGVSIRSAYTSNGTDIWVAGGTKNTAQLPGIHYTTVGSTTSTQVTAPDTNSGTSIVNGFNLGSGLQLFASDFRSGTQAVTAGAPTAAAFRGVAAVGTGLPETASTTMFPTQLPGFEATTTPPTGEQADNFWFKDANTLYIADQRNTSVGGVQKWVYNGTSSTWVFAYNMPLGTGTAGTAVGAHGLSGIVDAQGNTDLFATSFDGGLLTNQVYSMTDTGTTFTTPTLLATSATNSAFRGVAVVPYLMGDANNDGKVDLNDLNTVLNNLGRTSILRTDGNFDGAATIDLNDLNDVLNNLGQTFGGSSAAALSPEAVPEPASLGVLGVAAAGILIRRRRV